ncbi:hypothetical protein M2459_000851 [Parabacteroides sp. PF5-5]|uniref:hypothetical protein n=1 Tax=unclassified Parabacteroides TaxID=2649774 RepID=UPI002476548E|nr:MULTISPECIES: hypothetical protein [unclassified Parabacteroides]MDH6304139.1 hypothetical protein [Parabacteroides sp. PH5-39]MDH6315161.1 hypothetical protein [Parabacteroides sp. PF5-13]MDH6318806.1 hypothetical protein [Parabacteroides sp. PH5-13]MDH6322535.1 hypothetical protein [Parabacteroides sp. PH5-8]MDH6326313.1 hypothetical protein [Parabacteroides sp. PH5-41]
MKEYVKYLLVTVLAALVFYGGCGVNLISYCCDDCHSYGVEVVKSDICCDIHHHNHTCEHATETHTASCADHTQEADCCSLERISFEWNQVNMPDFQLEPLNFDIFNCQVVSLVPAINQTDILYADQNAPPLIVCPRAYLSLLTTLLI